MANLNSKTRNIVHDFLNNFLEPGHSLQSRHNRDHLNLKTNFKKPIPFQKSKFDAKFIF